MAKNNRKNAYLLAIQVPQSVLDYLIPNKVYLQLAEAYFSGALKLVKHPDKRIVVRFTRYESVSNSFDLALGSFRPIRPFLSIHQDIDKVIFARTAKISKDLNMFNLHIWQPDYEVKLANKNTSIDKNNAMRWLTVWVKKVISSIEDPNYMLEFKKEPSKQFLSGTHWIFRDYVRFADNYIRSIHLSRMGKKVDVIQTKVDMDNVFYHNVEKYLWEFSDWTAFYKQWHLPENREYKPVTAYKEFYAKYLKLTKNFTKFHTNLRIQFNTFYIQEYCCFSIENYVTLKTVSRNNLMLFSSLFIFHVFCTEFIPHLHCA